MTGKYRDIISAVFVIVLAAFIQYFSKDIIISSFTNLGADFFPRLISVILGALGIILLVISILKIKKDGLTGKDTEISVKDNTSCSGQKGSIISNNSDWISIILIIAYAYSIRYMGFVISTMIYLFLQMTLLSVKGKRSFLSFGLTAVIAPIIIYFIFTRVFSLMLPQGILG